MLRDKMTDLMTDVNSVVAERTELVEAIAIALLTRKNLFVLGDTGQAKSYAINQFRQRIIGAKQFERLLSKQADEEQLFGRVDLSSLIPGNADGEVLQRDEDYMITLDYLHGARQDNKSMEEIKQLVDDLETHRHRAYALYGNKPKLVTTGKIPDSHIVFLDEIFKANDGILNALLTALNERRFTNEGETVEIPTISFFAASNEIPNFNNPEDAILKPLYDRLELKLVTEYVEDKATRLQVMKDKQSAGHGSVQNTITLDELNQMQGEVEQVAVPDSVNELMDDILCDLREKSVHISDRKYFGYYPLAQAYAWLNGRSEVQSTDLLILRHYLWTSPDERTTINEVLERKCVNPLKDALDGVYKMALESQQDFIDSESISDPAKRIGKLRNEFLDLYENLSVMLGKSQSQEENAQINETVKQLESLSKNAHSTTTFTYAPLPELLSLRN